MIYENETQLLYKAKEAEGLTFGEIDKSGRITNENAKGHLGQIIEESFFGYAINSIAEADFENLGIELKVTPIKTNKNGSISAKERLVLNIINYHHEVMKSFVTSSFWSKNQSLLLMFYEWIPEVKRADYRILKTHLHRFSEEDLEIIKRDWEMIVSKIRDGKAHELSEGDTVYLGACTKGATKKSVRSQPYSEISAMQRAYSLKQSYMSTLARKVVSKETMVSITDASQLKKQSFEEMLQTKFSPYIGKTLDEIAHEKFIEINTKSKGFLQQFISTLLNIRGTSLDDIEEFSKANIQFKTVRLEPNGIPREHMSFKNINFNDWASEDWEESWIKQNFEETKYLFVVFEYKESEKVNPQRKLFFKGIKLWNMPMQEIEGRLKDFWSLGKQTLNEGVVLERKPWGSNYRISNNLPGPSSNGLCHVRPKAKDGSDKIKLPDGQMITKQAFWLDKEYVASVISS